jgi:hypothetical protein
MPIKRVLPGYPIYQGSKKISVIDYKGPASYVGGGETLTALQFGEGGIDFIEPMNKKLGWELWMVTSNTVFYGDYGRHALIRVLFRKENREIVKDAFFNAAVRDGQNLSTVPVRGVM